MSFINKICFLPFTLFLLNSNQTKQTGNIVQSHNILTNVTNIDCSYRLNFRLDTTSKSFRTEYFRLLVRGNTSEFQSKKKIISDSIYTSYDSMPFSQETVNQMSDAITKTPQPEFSYVIYKDVISSKVTYLDEIDPDKKYSYVEPLNLFSWQILTEKMIINGYTCQKAITSFRGRHFTAWFTREVPIAEGPYKFYGLPGLIIKISDANNYYTFDLLNIKKVQPSIIEVPKGTIPTTREKFIKALSDYNINYFEHAKQNGVTFSNPEAAKQTWKEKRKRNNPMELL